MRASDGHPEGDPPEEHLDEPFGWEIVDPDQHHDDDSPYLWMRSEWGESTWTEPELIQPSRDVDRFRRTTAGAMLAGGLLGLAQILETPKEQPPVIQQVPGEPPGPKRVEVLLEGDPAASTVIVRPHIL